MEGAATCHPMGRCPESGSFRPDVHADPESADRGFSETDNRVSKVLALYPATTNQEAKKNWADIYSAFYFTYGHSVWERQAESDGIPSYEYLFTRKNGRLGDWHSGEEVYFYGNIPESSRLYNEEDRKLSALMQQYFVNFIRTGNPNGEGLPRWPANTGAKDRILVLDQEIRMETDPFADLYPILDNEL